MNSVFFGVRRPNWWASWDDEARLRTKIMMRLMGSFAFVISGRRIRLVEPWLTAGRKWGAPPQPAVREDLDLMCEHYQFSMRCGQVHFQFVGMAYAGQTLALPFRLLFYMPREYYLHHGVARHLGNALKVMPSVILPGFPAPEVAGELSPGLPGEDFMTLRAYDLDSGQWLEDDDSGLTPIGLYAFSQDGEMHLFTFGSAGIGGVELNTPAREQVLRTADSHEMG